jgi:hypothetical protein
LPPVGALQSLPRAWWSTDLPGYREHPKPFATYSAFPYADLPPIRRPLDPDLNWLRDQPRVPRSLGDVDPGEAAPERRATAVDLAALLGGEKIALPQSFRRFVTDPAPRTRVRSATLCYLDLAQFVVDVVGGGSLIHFLSDQQWILHWLLYVGDDGSEAVVATETPLGFEAEEHHFTRFDPADGGATVCAESFSEFLYRFWIDNEIYFRTGASARDEPPLTDEQRRYAEHFR